MNVKNILFLKILLITIGISSSAQESWIIDRNGCKVFNPNPEFGESITWTGGCKDSMATGFGTLTWYRYGFKTKSQYMGEMIMGRPDGEGEYSYSNKWIQKGIFRNGDLVEGMDIYKRDTCIGIFKDDEFIEGKIMSKLGRDKFIYEGKFKNEVLTGYGKLIYKDFYTSEGTFENGMENGFCKRIYDDGSIFTGIFEDGYYSTGILERADGLKIDGVFDKYDAISGTIYYTDSTKYVGDIKLELPHGKGTFHFSNGDKFTCNWRFKKPYGNCEYQFFDGTLYINTLKRGQFHGWGKIIYPDGKVTKGYWKMSELIREIE